MEPVNYLTVDEMPLECIASALFREIHSGFRYLGTRCLALSPVLSYPLRLAAAIFLTITRWITTGITLSALLLMGGCHSHAYLIKLDVTCLMFLIYRNYKLVRLSLRESGFSNQTQRVMFETIPVCAISALYILIVCVVRGNQFYRSCNSSITNQNRVTIDMDPESNDSPPLASTSQIGRSATGINTARTSVSTPYRIACSSSEVASRGSVRRITCNIGAVWHLCPESSLRGTWYDLKRLISASCVSLYLNDLSLIVFLVFLWNAIVWSDYIYARTLDNQESICTEVYNIIMDKLGMLDRTSDIPSGVDNNSFDNNDCTELHELRTELQEVVVVQG